MDQDEVRKIILTGLEEHWGWLDPGKNPDLDNIAETYNDAVFLVARNHDVLVGTGAILFKECKTAEVVRMSVVKDMRRRGIGKMILEELLLYARRRGIERVVLETTDTWNDAIEFYRKSGFKITHYQDGDVYFEYVLT